MHETIHENLLIFLHDDTKCFAIFAKLFMYAGFIAFGTVPGPPNDFSVEDFNSTSISVSWTTPLSPNGIIITYELTYTADGDDLENEMAFNVSSDSTNTSYVVTIEGLKEFTLYCVSVRAFTSAGPGDSVKQLLRTDPDSSSPPTSVEVSVLSATALELSWQPPMLARGNLSGYEIEHNATMEGDIASTNITSPSILSFMYTDLLPFTFYSFRVRAYSTQPAAGDSGFQVHLGLFSTLVGAMTNESSE